MDARPPASSPAPEGSLLGAAVSLSAGDRRTAQLCLSAMGVLGSASLLGIAFSLYLVNHAPLLLLALSPLGRHMLLVAPIVDPVAFVAVLVTRRMLFYTASFHLGRALGPLGIPWIEARAARFGRFVRFLERLFNRYSHAVVLLMTGPTVSALAGISPMSGRVFGALAVTGLTLRSLLVLGFAAWIRDYIEIALAWIDEYWVPGTIVTIALVALYRWRRRTPLTVMED